MNNPVNPPPSPAFNELERVGLLARRLSHDLSNEMTCAVTSLALFKSIDESWEASEDLTALDHAVNRLGTILKHFGHILSTQVVTSGPTPIALAADEAAQAAGLSRLWSVTNQVRPDDQRTSRVSSRFLRGIIQEVSPGNSSPNGNPYGSLLFTVVEPSQKAEFPHLQLNDRPALLLEVRLNGGKPFDASKGNLYEAESSAQVLVMELIRQTQGRAFSAPEGLSVYWPLT